jgi:predicted amidohydrolase
LRTRIRTVAFALGLVLCGLQPLSAGEFNSRSFIAGCAQIFVTDNVQANLEKIVSYIHKADSQGVEILLFPETALSGYRPLHFKDKPFPPRDVLEAALEQVRREARETGMRIVLGTSAYADSGVYNIAYFIDERGEIRASFAKAHGTGNKDFLAGREISTFQYQGFKYGLEICYDARFPEAWRQQALAGADVIFHISHAAGGDAWKTPVWEGHLRSRAAENQYWVVSCNCAGPVQAGKSYIIDPDGLLVAESNQEKEELITGRVDLTRPLRGILWSRRLDLYRVVPGDTTAH